MSVRRKSRHVLGVVAALLLLSGAVRVVMGMGPAIAFAEEQLTQQEPAQLEPAAPRDVSPLLEALQERETRISAREVAIDDRLLALANAEAELTRRLEDVQEAEASLTAALALSETANDTDIARLTTVYENMKPADAAGLFEQMAPDFASGFLVRMNPQAAAAVLAGLEPETAYSISVIIAGRNANAPTE